MIPGGWRRLALLGQLYRNQTRIKQDWQLIASGGGELSETMWLKSEIAAINAAHAPRNPGRDAHFDSS
jgi:hypothetical protein